MRSIEGPLGTMADRVGDARAYLAQVADVELTAAETIIDSLRALHDKTPALTRAAMAPLVMGGA
jgi:hypothetical protein